MNEKEFLIKLLDYIDSAIFNYVWPIEERDKAIDDFLRIHHMKYKEVYFYEWEGKEKDIMKEQVKHKLRDFVDFLVEDRYFSEEHLQAKIDAYAERII